MRVSCGVDRYLPRPWRFVDCVRENGRSSGGMIDDCGTLTDFQDSKIQAGGFASIVLDAIGSLDGPENTC